MTLFSRLPNSSCAECYNFPQEDTGERDMNHAHLRPRRAGSPRRHHRPGPSRWCDCGPQSVTKSMRRSIKTRSPVQQAERDGVVDARLHAVVLHRHLAALADLDLKAME